MPPRKARTQKPRRTTRLRHASEQYYSEKPVRMNTRAISERSGKSHNSADNEAEHGEELDSSRPRKVSRTSDSQDDVHSSPGSSVAIVAAATDDDIDEDESVSGFPLTGAVGFEEEHVLDGTEDNSLEDVEGEQPLNSVQYVSESRQSTPSNEDPRVDQSDKAYGSRALGAIKKAQSNQEKNGKSTGADTPEPDKKGGLISRLPGRRRAPHPDLDIEVDLRRQLELKVAYRAVAKALKPVLADLADRTMRELEANEELHKSYPEYKDVLQELDVRLESRLRILGAQLREEEERRERQHEAEDEVIRRRYEYHCLDRREDRSLQCQRHILSLLREAAADEDSDATEYEDEIMPGTYRIDKATHQRSRIAKEYESRSRDFVETERKWSEMEMHMTFKDMQLAIDASSYDPRPRNFAVFDGRQRQAALAGLNILQLIDAGEEIEESAERAAAKPLPNSEAIGLQALADAVRIDALRSQPQFAPAPNFAHVKQEFLTQPSQFHPSSVINNAGRTTPPIMPHHSTSKKQSSRRRKSPKFHPILVPQSYAYQGQFPPQGQAMAPPNYHQHYGFQMPPVLPANEKHMEPVTFHPERSQAPLSVPLMHQSNNGHPAPVEFSARSLQRSRQAEPLKDEDRGNLNRASGNNVTTQPESRPSYGTPTSQTWTPFSNTMPPPNTLLPKYVKDNGLIRPEIDNTSPVTPKTGPAKSTSEWPGFSSNSSANHGRAASFDAKIAQRSTYPGLTHATSPRRNSPQLSWPQPGVSSAPPRHAPGITRPMSPLEGKPPLSQVILPSPFFQPPPGIHSFSQLNTRPGPLSNQSNSFQQQPAPPMHINHHNLPPPSPSQPPLSSDTSSATTPQGGRPRTADFSPIRRSVDRRDSRPITPSSQQRFQPPVGTSSSQQQGSAQQSQLPSPFSSLSRQPSLSRIQAAQNPGQPGHQRILPASMDPSRLASLGSEPTIAGPAYREQRTRLPFSAGAQNDHPIYTTPTSSSGPISAPATTDSFGEGLHGDHLRHALRTGRESPGLNPGLSQMQSYDPTHAPPPTSTGSQPSTQQKGQQSFRWQIYANIAPAPQHSAAHAPGERSHRPQQQQQRQTHRQDQTQDRNTAQSPSQDRLQQQPQQQQRQEGTLRWATTPGTQTQMSAPGSVPAPDGGPTASENQGDSGGGDKA